MKLVMDEKLKHRIIGLAVIVSLAAIFTPAIMRKSSQRLENISENVNLPPKPSAPNVVMTDEKDLFKTIKVARVDLPKESHESQLPELAKAQSIEAKREAANDTLALATDAPKAAPIKLALEEPTKPTQTLAKKVASPLAATTKAVAPLKDKGIKKSMYSVQVASLSKLSNAQSLINRLKAKGYKTNLAKVSTNRGTVYKVYAGQSPRKDEAQRLRTQLASAMQLNGFVVNTGVS